VRPRAATSRVDIGRRYDRAANGPGFDPGQIPNSIEPALRQIPQSDVRAGPDGTARLTHHGNDHLDVLATRRRRRADDGLTLDLGEPVVGGALPFGRQVVDLPTLGLAAVAGRVRMLLPRATVTAPSLA
jgi:hypothetical protein